MGKTATNISIILGLITVAFAGYYMYTQQVSPSLDFSANSQATQNMLNETKIFIERSDTLNKVSLDISFFEDERFTSLRSFTSPIRPQAEGRRDPFAETNLSAGSANNI